MVDIRALFWCLHFFIIASHVLRHLATIFCFSTIPIKDVGTREIKDKMLMLKSSWLDAATLLSEYAVRGADIVKLSRGVLDNTLTSTFPSSVPRRLSLLFESEAVPASEAQLRALVRCNLWTDALRLFLTTTLLWNMWPSQLASALATSLYLSRAPWSASVSLLCLTTQLPSQFFKSPELHIPPTVRHLTGLNLTAASLARHVSWSVLEQLCEQSFQTAGESILREVQMIALLHQGKHARLLEAFRSSRSPSPKMVLCAIRSISIVLQNGFDDQLCLDLSVLMEKSFHRWPELSPIFPFRIVAMTTRLCADSLDRSPSLPTYEAFLKLVDAVTKFPRPVVGSFLVHNPLVLKVLAAIQPNHHLVKEQRVTLLFLKPTELEALGLLQVQRGQWMDALRTVELIQQTPLTSAYSESEKHFIQTARAATSWELALGMFL